ncbi:uncharacterized protein DNG_08829 [Cephalotrichum gorgonifer]|uniref:Uncharacterized protein n=1 Tax=Cephalotrichum gorgonifer TaxID=2041049 RepID=A0AAE8N4H7_9PEZI|nr:uncharacterized protein DNG_08829 [Cephalotrichum gorgonifer]
MSLHAPRNLGRYALSGPRSLYTTTSTTARAFSHTPQVFSLPPESPDYIPIPKPPLSEENKPARVRGSLPVPRKIFPQVSDSRKLERSYLRETYPRSEKVPAPETNDPSHPQAWKRIMAESRRKNLRSGLKGLWQRKIKRDEKEAAVGANKLRDHVAAGLKAEGTDEFLTLPSILPATLQTEVIPDPERFEKAEASKRAMAEKAEEDRHERRNTIMELYMNAHDFIVEERELEAEVDKIFSENYWRDPSRNSAWDEWGTQAGLFDMVGQTVRNPPAHAVEHYTADYSRNMKRQKKTAEELTGGKMA